MKQILLKILLIITIIVCSAASAMILIYGNPFHKAEENLIELNEPMSFPTETNLPELPEEETPSVSSPAA